MRSIGIVTARLLGGRSTKQVLRFYRGERPRRVTVGTAADCGWSVAAAGVTPHHLALCWTGSALHVCCAPGTESVEVDDEPTTEARLQAGAVVRFGEAAFTVDAIQLSMPDDVLGEPPDPAQAVAIGRRPARSPEHRRLAVRALVLLVLLGCCAAAAFVLLIR